MRMLSYQSLTPATEQKWKGDRPPEMFDGLAYSTKCAQGHQLHTLVPIAIEKDILGIDPRASRMLSGCDSTTPCARKGAKIVRATVPLLQTLMPMNGVMS